MGDKNIGLDQKSELEVDTTKEEPLANEGPPVQLKTSVDDEPPAEVAPKAEAVSSAEEAPATEALTSTEAQSSGEADPSSESEPTAAATKETPSGNAAEGGPLQEDGQPQEIEENVEEPEQPSAEKADPFEVFRPKLYNFELYNYDKLKFMLFQNKRSDNLEIRCPEFSILLDHTIALLWLFYNDNKNWNKFTVPHIEWALKFISGIASENGHSFTDMDTIKRHLEELLFETYSDTDISMLDEKPPMEEVGVFGPIKCPSRTKSCTPIPETLKELLARAPDMVNNLILSNGSESEIVEEDNVEINRAKMMHSAYLKLNSFERKHLARITEEIELFEMVKALKQELGYNNGNVNPNEITTLRLRIEELEKMLLDQADRR